MPKVHFDAQGEGAFWPLQPECGERKGKRNAGPPVVTTDPDNVTCKRCKKTKAYLEAAAVALVESMEDAENG